MSWNVRAGGRGWLQRWVDVCPLPFPQPWPSTGRCILLSLLCFSLFLGSALGLLLFFPFALIPFALVAHFGFSFKVS